MFDFIPGNPADLSYDFINFVGPFGFSTYLQRMMTFFLPNLVSFVSFSCLSAEGKASVQCGMEMNSRHLCLIANPRGKVQHYAIKSETFYWFHNLCFHIPNLRFLVSICVLVASAGSQAECPFFLDCLLVLMASCSIALENSLGASQKPGRS